MVLVLDELLINSDPISKFQAVSLIAFSRRNIEVGYLQCQEGSSDGGRGLNVAEERTNKTIFGCPQEQVTARRRDN
jgi:hypothetical protein